MKRPKTMEFMKWRCARSKTAWEGFQWKSVKQTETLQDGETRRQSDSSVSCFQAFFGCLEGRKYRSRTWMATNH